MTLLRRIGLITTAAASLAFALLVPPAAAVINGTPDNGAPAKYPYVGTMVLQMPDQDGQHAYQYFCTGTMVTPRVFLAAGHCFTPEVIQGYFPGAQTLGVTFGVVDPTPGATLPTVYTGHAVTPADWPGWHWQLDVGAFLLDEPVPGLDQAKLPTLPKVGQLNTLALTGQTATIVGYGMTRAATGGPHGFTDLSDGFRRYADERITGVTPVMVHMLGNIASGGSGPCAGDSGAPRLVSTGSSALMLVSISARIGPKCQTPEQTLRLDTPDVQAFIARAIAETR